METFSNPAMLYAEAMIVELVARAVDHGLARFDFPQVTVARPLAELFQSGINPRALAKRRTKLGDRNFSHAEITMENC